MGGSQSQVPANFFYKSQSQLGILAIPAKYAVGGSFDDTYNFKS